MKQTPPLIQQMLSSKTHSNQEMDSDRPPHLRSTAAPSTELFICFTNRLSSSSSSMKLSKSILSPGRAARDGPASLSSSLSRRLRPNGSLKAGQASPFFPTTTRKRGCAFENPEPSSPKVTCIGQVRVKTKKKVKQSRSRRGGEVSFRKLDGGEQIEDKRYSNASAHYQPPQEHRNQRWVHLPISICEALRTLGAEFSCLFPCKTSCFSGERVGKSEKHEGCGAVFTRWLVSVNDGEGGKRREIELVVGGGDEEEEEAVSSRRHVFEDIEVKNDRIEVKGQGHLEEAARVSICIPPKNALLLMRCRSDPMKMADLATRFTWDAPKQDTEEEITVEENDVVSPEEDEVMVQDAVTCQEEAREEQEIRDEPQEDVCSGEQQTEAREEQEITDEPQEDLCSAEQREEQEIGDETQQDSCSGEQILEVEMPISIGDELQEEIRGSNDEEEEVESNMSSFEALLDQENTAESYEDCQIQDKEEVEDNSICHLSPSTVSDEEQEDQETVEETTSPNNDAESEHRETEPEPKTEELVSKKEKVLPECLVLMMCEPKLSMEVSKETWVCSRDFIRWLPRNEPLKRRLSIDSKPKTFAAAEPPRSSVIEHKLVNAVAYEPFVLTRCKSEPMRTAAAKLAPESCFWKNAIRKLEPHRRGVGAAGVGF